MKRIRAEAGGWSRILAMVRDQLVTAFERLIRKWVQRKLEEDNRVPLRGATGIAYTVLFDDELEERVLLESGFINLSGTCPNGERAPLAFTDYISTFTSDRITAGAFSLVGQMASRTSDSGGGYPPLQDFEGVDVPEGLSTHIVCEDGFINSSVWSGKMMRLWIQAKYGYDETVIQSAGHGMGVVIDGELVQNTVNQSDWVYEYSDGTGRLEWWAVSFASGVLKVGLLNLDEVSETLRSYTGSWFSTMTEDDKDWMRAWIFRGAAWPKSTPVDEWTTLDPGPISGGFGGLGYGWQVSASGAKASIHSYDQVISGSNTGSDWIRHDLVLTLSYPGDVRTWDAVLTTTDVGYLETSNQKGIVPWKLSQTGNLTWLLTDPQSTPPVPLASDAEVFGWYIGEDWNGKRLTDSGTVGNYCYPETPIPGCETTAWDLPNCSYGTGELCVTNRLVGFDGDIGRNGGDYPQCWISFYFVGSTITQDWTTDGGETPGPSHACTFTYEDPCTDPGDFLGEVQWQGSARQAARTYNTVDQVTHFAGFAVSPVVGASDALVFVKNWGNTNNQSWNELATVQSVWYEYQRRGKCILNGEPEDPWIMIGDYQATANTPFTYQVYLGAGSGPASKSNISATLMVAGEELTLWSDSGGTNTGAPGGENDYSGDGAIDLGGWGGYVDPDLATPVETPIKVRRSAIEEILDSCTTPACTDRIANDTSVADPMPTEGTWIGRS